MRPEKKCYQKPALKAQRITLGVYGNYQGDEVKPLFPVNGKDLSGDITRTS
jgi:hypothetical protein